MAVVAGDEKKKNVGAQRLSRLNCHIIRIKTLVIKSTKQLDEKKNKSGDKTVKEPDEKKSKEGEKGTIHMKALAEVMKKKLNKNVGEEWRVVERRKKRTRSPEKRMRKMTGDGEKKNKNKKRDGGDKGGDGGGKVEGNIMMESVQYRYSYAYGPGYMAESLRMFSAENPNACVVM